MPNCEQLPGAGYAFERVCSFIGEFDLGAGNEVLDRRGDEDFAGLGLGGNPGADVDGDAGQFALVAFALSRV